MTAKAKTKGKKAAAEARAQAAPETPAVPTRRTTKLDLPVLATYTDEELERVMRRGKAPALDSIAGWEFHGYNTPFYTRVLGFRKFVKGFKRGSDGSVTGYNVVIKQNGGPLEPWTAVRLFGRPIRHGYYKVETVDPYARDSLYPNALLLDYGAGDNFFLNPSRTLRDYLVQVDPENPDLLLGKAVLALGPFRREMSFFILQRAHQAEG